MLRSAFTVAQPTSTALRPLNYTPAVERLRTSRGRSVRLGSLLREVGPSYGTVFTRLDCAPEHGIELMSQSDMFAAEPSGRVIRRDSMAKPERHLVRRWQVLIAGAGTLGENELYGRCVITDGRLVGKYVGPDALTLTFVDEGSDLSLYVYAFLASSLGVRALRSASYGTKILRMRSDIVSELPIPLADDSTVARVAALIRETVEQRERFAASLGAARRVIEELPEVCEAREMCADRRARCITWQSDLPTIGAWNYASTGGAHALLASKWSGRLADVVPRGGIFRGNRFARIECKAPHGVDLVSQRDVFLVRPVPQRVLVSGAELARLTAPVGSLLVGGQGTLGEGEIFGRVVLVTQSLKDMAVTEHLLRIQPEAAQSALVYAYLSTLVGLRLLRATAVGTKLLSLRADLLFKIPVPELSVALHRRVQNAIDEALASHELASQAEAAAIRIIEEEVLPQWLA